MRQRGNTIVGLLVSVVIIMVLMVALFYGSGMFGGKGSTRKDGLGKTIPGAALAAAKDTATMERLSQVRQAIELYKINNDDQVPASLADLKLPAELTQDAIGKEPFGYDATTGQVWSVHPGHEKY